MRNILLILSFFFIKYSLHCQQVISPLVPYEVGFQFKEGVFLSFNDFKFNNAIPFEDVIDKNGNPIDFKKLMDEESTIENLNNRITPFKTNEIRVFQSDTIIDYNLDKLWGLSNGRNIFINLRERGFGIRVPLMSDTANHNPNLEVEVTRIGKIGSICHIADFDTYSSNFNQYNQPYPSIPNGKIDVDQFILVMATGKIYKFNLEGMSVALEHDTELLTLFLNESNDAKKDKLKAILYKYLVLYNKKYPLYFPK